MVSRRGFLTGAGGLSLMGLLAACSTGGGSTKQLAASAKQTLVMLNYSGWIGSENIATFRKQHSAVSIKQTDLPSGGSGGIKTLIRQNPSSYDFALLGNGTAKTAAAGGILNAFDAGEVANLSNIPEQFRKAYPWGMPLEQGKVGIIYRKDFVDSPPTSWKELFAQTTGRLSGKVLFPNYDVDVLAIAMLANGDDINTADTKKISAAADLVIAAKPDIKAFIDSDRIKALKSGPATVAVGYDYDTAGALGVDDTIGWIAPSEGTPAYLDGWAMFRESEHHAAVYDFMDFVLEPANYANFINTTGASYLMPKAESQISSDITGNEALALDLDLTVLYEEYVSGEVEAYKNQMWQKIQAA